MRVAMSVDVERFRLPGRGSCSTADAAGLLRALTEVPDRSKV